MSADVNSFRLNYRITNISKGEVVVRMKGGISYLIRGSKEPTFVNERLLYVSIQGVYLDDILIDESQGLTNLDRRILIELSKELQNKRTKDPHYYSQLPVSLEVCIELTQSLIETRNAIHSELLGITLYPGMSNEHQPAFNTPVMTMRELFESISRKMEQPEGLGFFAYLNDPKRVGPLLYTNILGKATEIPRAANIEKKPGLYIGLSQGIEPQEPLYYRFDDLETKTLESLGIFETKTACEKGGNTERYLNAEARIKDLQKEVRDITGQFGSVSESLNKAEGANTRLQAELDKLKYDHKQELASIKLQHQVSSDISKAESRIQSVVSKANFDLVKHKASQNTWGDFAKAVGTLAGVAFTGYRLFTS